MLTYYHAGYWYFLRTDVRIVQVAAGSGHTAFLSADGVLYTCGRGDDGRLGHGDAQWLYVPKPVEALKAARVRVRFVACGSYHTAAISTAGQLWTFGGALYSKLGHGDEQPCALPRMVSALATKRVIAVACGSRHTVALVAAQLPHQQQQELADDGNPSAELSGNQVRLVAGVPRLS
jgi:RCC1 and BTB domain-containing protein